MGKRSNNFKDLTGQVFHYLTVIRIAGKSKNGNYNWLCSCSGCGGETIVQSTHLKIGKRGARSCSCMKKRIISEKIGRHHMAGKPEYKSWQGMKRRCTNIKSQDYGRYGGRGIKICERWFESFDNFFEDMQLRPGPEYTLERKDVNGNYQKSNCIWADKTTQARNRRYNATFTYKNETKTIAEWSEITGISRYTLYVRKRMGRPAEDALTDISRLRKI